MQPSFNTAPRKAVSPQRGPNSVTTSFMNIAWTQSSTVLPGSWQNFTGHTGSI